MRSNTWGRGALWILLIMCLAENSFALPPLPSGFPGLPESGSSGGFRRFGSEDLPTPPGDGGPGGDGGGGGSPGYTFDLSGLYLEIVGVTNGLAYLNLHNAASPVYAIWSTTNLPGNWQVELKLWPTNPVVMPFTAPTLGRTNLFLRAEVWDNVTENGNTTPDWWFFAFYGANAFSNAVLTLSDTNLDSQGNTLLSDYQNGLDPNVISFSLATTNNYVSAGTPALQLGVSQGNPSFAAVLVDSTNFDGASWNAYASSNVTVNLGSTEGWHDVWIGLRGLPANAVQTWQWQRLKLDRTPPAFVLTGPASVVSQSLVQLTGYSPELLSQIAYDLANANGLLTNQQVLVLDQHYDTNTSEFTTNTFQAFDVALAPGTNFFTLHAADLAGNVTTANFTLTLGSDTTAPALTLVYPQDGMQLCGSAFTIFGTVDDVSASLTATLVDSGGNTNTFNALIERNGKFWLEDLPLTAGTNWLTLNAVDIWGNTSATNFTVTQSTLGLTVDPIDDSQLYLPTINLTGTVSDANYAIWANGVQGANNGDGTWSATNVPITSGGTARFTVSAYPPGDALSTDTLPAFANPADTNSANAAVTQDKPSRLYVESYFEPRSYADHVIAIYGNGQRYEDDVTGTGYGFWKDGAGGAATMEFKSVWSSPTSGGLRTNTCIMEQDFYPSYYPTLLPGPTPVPCSDTYPLPVALAWQHAEVFTKQDYSVTNRDGDYYFEHLVDKFSAQAKIKLYTGGKAGVNRQNLWAISGSATEHRQIGVTSGINVPIWTNVPVPPGQITMGELGALGNDGIRWTTLPDDTTRTITPTADGLNWYYFQVNAQKYKLAISANGNDLSVTNPEFCVGQQITFAPAWSPAPPPSVADISAHWTLPDKYVNESWQHYFHDDDSDYDTNNNPVIYYGSVNYRVNSDLLTNISTSCWYVNGQGGKVSMFENLHFTNGQYVSVAAQGSIMIYRPQVTLFTNYPPFTPMVTNGWLELGRDDYGSPGDTNFDGEMNFRATITTKTNFPGQVGWTQLANRNVTLMPIIGTFGEYWLDNGQFFDTPDRVETNFVLRFVDGPGIGTMGDIPVSITDQYQTYLMFNPGGDSIWVTLGKVTWGWSGSESSGTTLNSSSVTPPRYSDPDELPVWKSIIYSSKGQ